MLKSISQNKNNNHLFVISALLVICFKTLSITPLNAKDFLCYSCLLETDGADYCRYYEYEIAYAKYSKGMRKPCSSRGTVRSTVGGGRGTLTSKYYGKHDSYAWCQKIVTNEARTFPPFDSAGRCFRTFVNGKLFATSRHNISNLKPRGYSRGKTANSGRDFVGRSTKFRNNGKNDAAFAATLIAPNHVIKKITVENTNGQRSVWDTAPNNRYWLGVAMINGRVINHRDGAVNHRLGPGKTSLNFYCEDNGSVRGNRTDYRMTVNFGNGSKVVIPFGR